VSRDLANIADEPVSIHGLDARALKRTEGIDGEQDRM
jgi:hypothetical protein